MRPYFLSTAAYFLCLAASISLSTGCMRQHVYKPSPVVDTSFVHKYGLEVPMDEWEARGKSGCVVQTLKTGVVVKEEFSDGLLHGLTSCTFPHCEAVERTSLYEKGVLRQEIFYSPSGIPLCRVDYPAEGGKIVARWYESGVPKSLERYSAGKFVSGEYFSISNQLEARVIEGEGNHPVRDDYGQLICFEDVADGLTHLRTTFHQNGTPKEIIQLQEGKPHGRCKSFLPGGEPNTDEEWKNGLQEGISIEFQNGEKFAEVPYVAGRKNGREQRWRDSRLIEEISWQDGLRHGVSYVYITGTPLAEWYYKGTAVTKSAFKELSNQ